MMDLKPCPFCDGVAILVEKITHFKYSTNKGGGLRDPISEFYVKCNDMDCEADVKTLERFTEKEVVEAWNTRYAY